MEVSLELDLLGDDLPLSTLPVVQDTLASALKGLLGYECYIQRTSFTDLVSRGFSRGFFLYSEGAVRQL